VEVRLPRSLPEARRAYDLADALGRLALERFPRFDGVRVRVHRNRSTLIRWRQRGDVMELAVHEAFLPHPTDVLAVVGDRCPAAWERLQALPRAVTPPRLRAEGSVHHLMPLWEEEVARVQAVAPFDADPLVGWGRWPGRPPKRSLRLGSCQPGPPEVVRVHPVLDHRSVPDWFVGFVLYHELLHLRFPPITRGRRRIVHPRSFRQAERRHPRFAEAEAWESEQIGALLRRARARVARRSRR